MKTFVSASNLTLYLSQLTTQMDLLELHLKLEKLDPAQVPDASIAQKDEAYKKMNVDWTEVEKLGQQFLAEVCTDYITSNLLGYINNKQRSSVFVCTGQTVVPPL